MEYVTLGRTGMSVSRLCLGSFSFGEAGGNPDQADCARIVHAALDAGVNFVDTANRYGQGESEEIVGKALAGRRDDVVLSTKFGFPMGDERNSQGSSRRHIVRAVEDSLRRLKTDWIDLYQCHRPDPTSDIDETLGALSSLVDAGKVRAIGSSTFPAHEIVEAQWVAERRGRERFATNQSQYSILVREAEADVLPVCQRYDVGFMAWSPLAGGWLTGRYRTGVAPGGVRAELMPDRFDPAHGQNAAKLQAAEDLAVLAEGAGLSLIDLSLGFVLNHPAVGVAIVGPRTMGHLETYLAAGETRLDADVLDRIDEIVPPGVTVNRLDTTWRPPALTEPALRRRHGALAASPAAG